MNGDGRGELPAEFLDLVDDYCSGLIDETGVRRLEADLLESAEARRHFAEYFHHHTEIQFAVRAGQAAEAVLERLASPGAGAARRGRSGAARRSPARARCGVAWMGLAALLATAAAVVVWLGSGRPVASAADRRPAKPAGENIAWLVNAQDCRWDEHGPEARAATCEPARSCAWSGGWPRSSSTAARGSSSRDRPASSSSRAVGAAPQRHADRPGARPRPRVHRAHRRTARSSTWGPNSGCRSTTAARPRVRVFTGEVEAFPLVSDRAGRSRRDDPPGPGGPDRRPHGRPSSRPAPRRTPCTTSGPSCRRRSVTPRTLQPRLHPPRPGHAPRRRGPRDRADPPAARHRGRPARARSQPPPRPRPPAPWS